MHTARVIQAHIGRQGIGVSIDSCRQRLHDPQPRQLMCDCAEVARIELRRNNDLNVTFRGWQRIGAPVFDHLECHALQQSKLLL
jgi:hypothetical protein